MSVLRAQPACSIDAIVCDPPYGLEFMGKDWDSPDALLSTNSPRAQKFADQVSKTLPRSAEELAREQRAAMRKFQAWCVGWTAACFRVLKPGGHLLAFGGTRTYHRMACAIEDAGFEVRDSLHWIYGSGFPKSLDVSKAIDKAAGAEREVVGRKMSAGGRSSSPNPMDRDRGVLNAKTVPVTAPATDAARQWAGWGTALKPAHEPIVVARKPLDGTVAANVLAHGTGAINVDGCRVPGALEGDPTRFAKTDGGAFASFSVSPPQVRAEGRWPPNILLSHTPDCGDECAEGCAVAAMDGQNEGASKFFPCFRYQAKASRADRDSGLRDAGVGALRDAGVGALRDGGRGAQGFNFHPTVKPTELMQWLVRLVTPPGGLVLDPFAGSGSTGIAALREGFRFAGVELLPDHYEIALARIANAAARKGDQ